MGKKRAYTADDISSFEMDKDRVQHFPHLYIPDKKLAGIIHLFREIKDNADDEVMQGLLNGDDVDPTIYVSIDEGERCLTVRDSGSGIPHEKLRELCEVLHSGGKFSKGKGKAYSMAGGMHGVGLKLANFLSDYLVCTSVRDGIEYSVHYELGEFHHEEKKSVSKKLHGTTVKFRPSSKFLKDTDKLKCGIVRDMVEAKAECCRLLTTDFTAISKNGKETHEVFKGMEPMDIVRKYNDITSKTWSFDYSEDELKMQVTFGYDVKMIEGSNVMGYCNYIKNIAGGTHVNGLINGLTDFFKKYMDTKYLSEKDKNDLQIKKDDIRLGLCGAIIVLMTNAEFKGQYKEELTTDWLEDSVAKWIRNEMKKLPDKDLQEIAYIIKNNAKARLSSLRARTQAKKLGNRLSNDTVDNHIAAPISYDGDYLEVYMCEGLSAGEQLRTARYEFQEIIKLRGKVDNCFDTPINELNKKEIIRKMGQVFEMVPGKRGQRLKYMAYKILSDADPDGLYIRAQLVVVFAVSFPDVIDAGRLFEVVPPLYSFKINGKKEFVATNRQYLEYIQRKFSEENKLYFNDKKMTSDALLSFLVRNENYTNCVDKLARNEIVRPYLMELICANIRDLGIDKSSIPAWDKLISKEYSNQFSVSWENNEVCIEGIKDGRTEIIELNKELLKSERMQKVLNLMDANMGKIYNYKLKNTDNNEISIYRVMEEFMKYEPKSLKRYKGLGQMSSEDLDDTCMNLENQICRQITWGDVDKAMRTLATWHSDKPQFRNERQVLMANYVPDIQDIDT